MKNQNSKKFTPSTLFAIVIGLTLAFTDDYIVEFFGNHPTLGISFVTILLLSIFAFVRINKVKESNS